MTGFLLRRLVQALIVIFFVSIVTLLLLHLFPGGPIRALLGPRASQAQVDYYNKLYGYDQPIYVQWWKWIGQIFHGNLGFSLKLNQSVSSAIMQRLPKTIVLIALGTIVTLVGYHALRIVAPAHQGDGDSDSDSDSAIRTARTNGHQDLQGEPAP